MVLARPVLASLFLAGACLAALVAPVLTRLTQGLPLFDAVAARLALAA
jgi:hypothetical protein